MKKKDLLLYKYVKSINRPLQDINVTNTCDNFHNTFIAAKQDIVIEKDVETVADQDELNRLEKEFQNIDHKLDQEIHSIEKRSLKDENDDGLMLGDDSHSLERRAAYKYKFLQELNVAKTVETLVVVDKHMYHKHGDANVTTYTLTLFNMVSGSWSNGK